MQRSGCQALVPLFGDPVVAAPFRQPGVAAVVRALAILQDVETALKSMGAVGAPGMANTSGGVGSNGRPKANVNREKWARAIKKVPFMGLRCTSMTVPEPCSFHDDLTLCRKRRAEHSSETFFCWISLLVV